MTLIDWIQGISSAAAFLTALAALLTVRQMRDQRRSQFKPDVVIDDQPFRVLQHRGAVRYPYLQVAVEGREPDVNLLSRGNLFLRVRNVGLGTAKETQITMTFDAQGFTEKITAANPGLGSRLETTHDFVTSNETDGMWSAIRTQTERFGVIPANAASQGGEVPYPYAYTHMLVMHLGAIQPGAIGQGVPDWEVPPLRIEISYKDLERLAHRKKLVAHFEIAYIKGPSAGGNDSDWDEISGGRITVTEA